MNYKPAVLDAGNKKKPLNPEYTFRICWKEETAPGHYQTFRQTFDINRDYPDVKERYAVALLMVQLINDALAGGWRYHTDKAALGNEAATDYQSINIIDSLTEHQRSKSSGMGSVRSAQSYKSSVKLFCEYLEAKKWAQLSVYDLTVRHAQLYQDHMIGRKKSPATANNEIIRLGVVFERIKKQYNLPHNPFKQLSPLREKESLLFAEMTDEELQIIIPCLKQKCPELYLAFLHVYYGYLRPSSIVCLKRKHYDFNNRLIHVAPVSHKPGTQTIKQILTPLYDALINAGVDRLEPEAYVFSTGLKPGYRKIASVRFSEQWRILVIEGLGIDKKMYAGKSTGAGNFLDLNAGEENLLWFQKQMGHNNLGSSRSYLNKRKTFLLDETRARIKKL